MLGESYFFADYYSASNNVYEQLIKQYQYTRHLDVVVHRLFAIGRYWEHLSKNEYWWRLNFTNKTEPLIDTYGYAVRAFDVIRLNDPTGPLADASLMAEGNAHFVREQYEDADYNYNLVRKEYPKSQYQVQAHLLGMREKEKIYQGPMYDATVLRTPTRSPSRPSPSSARNWATSGRTSSTPATTSTRSWPTATWCGGVLREEAVLWLGEVLLCGVDEELPPHARRRDGPGAAAADQRLPRRAAQPLQVAHGPLRGEEVVGRSAAVGWALARRVGQPAARPREGG